MKVIAITILIAVTLALLLCTGCTNVREVGQVNGLNVTRITTRGVFSPSSTAIVLSDPSKPGTIEHADAAHGPGFVPAVANASGIAGGAALLRPSRVSQNGGGANANSFSNSSAANGGTAVTVNPSGGNTQNGAVHHNTGNGNGSGNNGNH